MFIGSAEPDRQCPPPQAICCQCSESPVFVEQTAHTLILGDHNSGSIDIGVRHNGTGEGNAAVRSRDLVRFHGYAGTV